MGGKSETTQQTSQQSQLTPWAPASGQIQGILSGLNPSIANLAGTPAVNDAYAALFANASNPNPLGPLAMGAATSLLGGSANYGAATNTLNGGYDATRAALAPFLSGLPGSDPATAAPLGTLQSDIGNQIGSQLAAAGRFGSPDMAQAEARGFAQGSAPILQNAMTNRLQAAGMLGSAASSTASGLTSADAANAG